MKIKPAHLDPAKLIARRKFLGNKTQADIAARAKMPTPHYNRIESGGRVNPSLDTAVRIARALGCLVEDLLVE